MDVVKILLENGADANIPTNTGETPLHVVGKYLKVSRFL
jgi:hypothetical protein